MSVCVVDFARVTLAVAVWRRAAIELKGCFCSSDSGSAQSARTGLSPTADLGAEPGREPGSLSNAHTHTVNIYALNMVWRLGLVSKFE